MINCHFGFIKVEIKASGSGSLYRWHSNYATIAVNVIPHKIYPGKQLCLKSNLNTEKILFKGVLKLAIGHYVKGSLQFRKVFK